MKHNVAGTIHVYPNVRRTTVAKCPIGLFLWNETLCLMTEYSSDSNQRDSYIVSSGEYFWGGAGTSVERARLMVTPCKVGR